jgi:hypothetical protein
MASSINASLTAGIVQTADTSGDLNIQSGGTTKIAVTSSGVAVTGLSKGSLPTGSVLQVVQGAYSTQVNNSTTTYADTGLTATITPTSATSKILVSVSQLFYKSAGHTQNGVNTKVFRNSTDLGQFTYVLGYTNSLLEVYVQATIQYLDSPATTSATTYKTQFANQTNAASVGAQQGNTGSSTITLMEIAA